MASLALITQYMIFTSTSLKKPSYTMPLGYLTIITTFLADIIFFQTSFGAWQISGMILTSVGLFGKLLLG
jgi:drug/metabolite transporter (DMT)-like permease